MIVLTFYALQLSSKVKLCSAYNTLYYTKIWLNQKPVNFIVSEFSKCFFSGILANWSKCLYLVRGLVWLSNSIHWPYIIDWCQTFVTYDFSTHFLARRHFYYNFTITNCCLCCVIELVERVESVNPISQTKTNIKFWRFHPPVSRLNIWRLSGQWVNRWKMQ